MMKKGVLAKLISLFVIVLFFFSLVSIITAQGPDRESPSEGIGGTLFTDENEPIDNNDEGVWLPCFRESEDDGCSYPSDDTYNQDDLTIDIKNIYSEFGIDITEMVPINEISYIKFVLDPLLYYVDEQGSFSSQRFDTGELDDDAFYAGYGGGNIPDPDECYTCTYNNLDECFIFDPENRYGDLQFDWICAEVNLLESSDCSEMADWNGPFCEGLTGIGEKNAGLTQYGVSERMPVSILTKPGLGGCYETDVESAPGRDWLYSPEIAGYGEPVRMRDAFSDYYHPVDYFDAIGRCCGNDPEDVGALVRGDNNRENPNFFLCSMDQGGNYVWMPAATPDTVGWIWRNNLTLEDNTYLFDAVSNANNWFICDSPISLEDEVYDFANLQQWESPGTSGHGPLLRQYQVPPAAYGAIDYGTTANVGNEDTGNPFLDGPSSADGGGLGSDASPVDQDSFENSIESVTGFSESDKCDKDGDGYAGKWTLENPPSTEAYLEGFRTDLAGECSNPQGEFDCDDTRADVNPGAIDYCDEDAVDGDGDPVNLDNDCDNEETACIHLPGGENPEGLSGSIDLAAINNRFLCGQSDDAGVFSECCSYNLDWCINNMKGRREGGPINAIQEFSRYGGVDYSPDRNVVLRYGVSKLDSLGPELIEEAIADNDAFRLGLPKKFYDSELTDWRDYKYFEFYLWSTTNFVIDIGLGRLQAHSANEDYFQNYIIRFRKPVIDYAVNEPGLKKWMHIKIPIEDIYGSEAEGYEDYFPVDIILFFTDIKTLNGLDKSEVTVNWDGTQKTFSNYIGIDKFFLTPKTEDIRLAKLPEPVEDGEDNFFCSGTWPPVWVSDLDDDSPVQTNDPSIIGEKRGMSACNAIPSYGWTGSACCGDDTGRDLIEEGQPELVFKEFYSDDEAGCWAGNVLHDDSRAMLIKYGVYYGPKDSSGVDYGFHSEVERSCFGRSCLFSVPPREEIFLSNTYPEIYDMLAFQSGDNRVRVNRSYLAGKAIHGIKVEDVPLQVQFKDGEFWACNPAEYIQDMRVHDLSEEDGERIFADDGSQFFESCQVKGNYFCDHINGTNDGWSDIPVFKYPLSTNITLEDGSIFETSEDTIQATYRLHTKTNYNIIVNPGFEDV